MTLALMAGLLAPATATAASFQVIGQFNVSWDVGVVGPPSFGVDLHLPIIPTDAWSIPQPSVGPYFQAMWGDRRRQAFGVRGGATWLSCCGLTTHWVVFATEGELAVTREGRATAAHLGLRATGGLVLTGSFGLAYDTAVAARPGRVSVDLGTGFQQVPVAVEGRPLRDGAGILLAVADATRVRHPRWIETARAEFASIPAFLRLAVELRAVAAPMPLVARALDAAGDELRHTVLALRASGAREARMTLDVPPARLFASRADALTTLGAESWADGWLNEGRNAREAAARSRFARGEEARTEAVIAVEEARHARLGLDVWRWCADELARA